MKDADRPKPNTHWELHIGGLSPHLHSARRVLGTRFWASDTVVMTTMAIVVGIGGGLGTVAFRKAVDAVTSAIFGGALAWTSMPIGHLILPALGGLLVGLWMYWLSPKGPGQGVAGIMEAVALYGGRIGPRTAIARVIGAILTIGTGGSAGPEDPSVQIGSTFGSVVSQSLKLSETRMRTLVGCGAAAGLSAAFNAPIAGTFFAMEIILGEFSGTSIGFVVMSAVAGAVVTQSVLGSQPAFAIPVYELKSPFELILYGLLGVCAAIVAVLYINSLQAVETLAERTERIPAWVKPAIGGLVVGFLSLIIGPDILGIGYSAIGSAFQNPTSGWAFFALLVLFKLLATTITLGSGGQGGLFAPSLFLGGMLGVAFGLGINSIFPSLAVPPAAYGLVGMAAVLSGAVRAPLTAIILPFEMTNDYRIIVPLMAAATISYLLAQKLQPDSVYTQRHRKRGIDLRARKDQDLMRTILVGQAMTPPSQMKTIPESLSIKDLTALFQKTGRHGFPVVDDQSRLVGIVALEDLERSVAAGQVEGTVADIYTRHVIVAYADESLEQALARLNTQDVGRIPVVDRRHPERLVGVLRRSDITRAYLQALADATNQSRRREKLKLEGLTGAQFVEIDLNQEDPVVGKEIKDVKLPPETVLVSIRRGNRVIIPRGGTILSAQDRILAAAAPAYVAALRQVLKKQSENGHTGRD